MSLPSARHETHRLRLVEPLESVQNLVEVDGLTGRLWHQLIDRADSDVFHSPAWMQVLADTYDFEPRALVLLDDSDTPVAGVPFIRVRDMIGERIVSLPFSDYCDPLVDNIEQWSLLSDKLLTEGRPVIIRPLHNGVPLEDPRFARTNRARWHGLDLSADLDAIWGSLDDRASVRKAQKDGVVVRVAEDEETVRAFFDLHLRSRKYKYGMLAQPYHFFQNIWRLLLEPGNGALMVATYEDEIIGGALFLEWKGRLYYKFNASLREGLSHRPNDVLIWEGIRYAKEKGCNYLDFGLTDWDQEALVQFKRKFARDEKTISFLKYLPTEGPSRHEKEVRTLLSKVTELLTDQNVPDDVTGRAGDLLYRFFV